jgi:hypothetical protein
MLRRASITVVIAVAVIAAESTSPAAARQPQVATERPPGPSVDFVAIDAAGSPVLDLQSSDIEVRIADRVRVVRTLRRVSAAPTSTAAGASPRVPPPYGTNDEVAAGRRFVLVIDQESFSAGREQLFRRRSKGCCRTSHPRIGRWSPRFHLAA